MDVPYVAPMLSYEDVGAAADWLCSAFGFEEVSRFHDGGHVTHVNLRVGEGAIMLGWPGPSYQSPRRHRQVCGDADRWLDNPFVVDGVYVRVAEIDAHCAKAREAGAMILSEVEVNEPVGQRQYRAEDIEGHRWMLAEPL